ncbi:TetR/AcrR family transcriptional regulator [Streptomyces sp. GC420]|uniref:TetR/AcrR family transcriptional regulator n=1 Tax=Streptomyces sp. GC420 TaxID=2697568 RepID=UPI001414FABC|nr:TetR/AcrR family transcriptional regulator [Streptomyces sp. GC420]NBM18226.1 TetR family transcriptional regulator [Streptomyces sp. GC420]
MPELTEARHDRFLRAAVDCFSRFGYRRTSMDVIARAAKVSRPALYQYFRNKEEIFRAAVRWGLEGVADRAEAAARKPGADAAERLSAVLFLVLGMHGTGDADRPGSGPGFGAELAAETYQQANDVWVAFEDRIVGVLRSVLEGHPDTFDPSALGARAAETATMLLYATKGIALQARGTPEAAGHVRLLVDMAVRGLTPPRPPHETL